MDPSSLRTLIEQVASGECTPDDAVRQLRRLPYADLGFARVDHHRDLRQGIPEAVYGPGKTPEQCAAIVAELAGTSPEMVARVYSHLSDKKAQLMKVAGDVRPRRFAQPSQAGRGVRSAR